MIVTPPSYPGPMPDPIIPTLTPDERRVLLAGLLNGPERDAVWTELWPAVNHLGRLGLVEFTNPRGANGNVLVSVALCLTPYGFRVARELRDGG